MRASTLVDGDFKTSHYAVGIDRNDAAKRHRAVFVNGDLLALTLYRKGALAVAAALIGMHDARPVLTRDGRGEPSPAKVPHSEAKRKKTDDSLTPETSVMNTITTPQFESFRALVSHAETLHAELSTLNEATRQLEDTLGITIARADELPCLIAQASYPLDRRWLEEEQAAIEQPMTLRIRQVQLQNELRQGLANIGDSLRAAIDAARTHVTMAAGGAQAVEKSTLARRHLSMLTRYRSPLPATETIRLRLGLLTTAWQVIDAAISSLDAIRFDAHRGA